MHHESFKRLLEDCLEASSHCSSACLREDESYVLTRCSKLNHTAAIACNLALKTMGAGTELLSKVWRLCIETCTNCAEECKKFTHIEHCNQAAANCRKIVEQCRLYLATVPDDYNAITTERYELY